MVRWESAKGEAGFRYNTMQGSYCKSRMAKNITLLDWKIVITKDFFDTRVPAIAHLPGFSRDLFVPYNDLAAVLTNGPWVGNDWKKWLYGHDIPPKACHVRKEGPGSWALPVVARFIARRILAGVFRLGPPDWSNGLQMRMASFWPFERGRVRDP